MGNWYCTIENCSEEDISIQAFERSEEDLIHASNPAKLWMVPKKTTQKIELSGEERPSMKLRFVFNSKHYYFPVPREARIKLGINGLIQLITVFENVETVTESLPSFPCRCLQNPEPSEPPDESESSFFSKNAATVAGGVTGGLAAPTVAVAGIQAIGFGAGGITAGSTAAGMMSSAAIANGGGVAAGSFVATCQSIGALGTLAAGPALVVGVAGVGLGAAAVYGGFKVYEHFCPSEGQSAPCWDQCHHSFEGELLLSSKKL